MGASERRKEINQRRHRRKKMGLWKKRAEKASSSEKAAIAAKVRELTPDGADQIIATLALEER